MTQSSIHFHIFLFLLTFSSHPPPPPLSAFLKWTAYPPDANHGFYVASGVITAVLLNGGQVPSPSVTSSSSLSSLFTDNSKSFPVRIYTDPLLVTMPTPDFSMPYNVICLVSTAVAIAFGTVHNQVPGGEG